MILVLDRLLIHSFSKLIYISRGFRSTLNHALLLLIGFPRFSQTVDMVHEDYLLIASIMQREQWSIFSNIYHYISQYRGTWQFNEFGWVIVYYHPFLNLLFFLVWIQLKGWWWPSAHIRSRWSTLRSSTIFFPSCPVDSRNAYHLRTRVGLHRLSSKSRRLIFLLTQNAPTLLSGLKARRTSSARAWSNIPRLVQHPCSQMFDTRISRLQEKDFSLTIRLFTIVNGRFTLSLIPWRRLAYLFTTSIASASLRANIL